MFTTLLPNAGPFDRLFRYLMQSHPAVVWSRGPRRPAEGALRRPPAHLFDDLGLTTEREEEEAIGQDWTSLTAPLSSLQRRMAWMGKAGCRNTPDLSGSSWEEPFSTWPKGR